MYRNSQIHAHKNLINSAKHKMINRIKKNRKSNKKNNLKNYIVKRVWK